MFKGYTWGWPGERGTWVGAAADHSLRELAATGTEWVALALAFRQESHQIPALPLDQPTVVTDDEIRQRIRACHDLGLKVCLKPTVNPRGVWRARINFGADDDAWRRWFADYEAYQVHMARIAQEENCAMVCVGCEMNDSEERPDGWRRVIGAVRSVFTGLVTYNCNHGREEAVTFWDEVDYISTSAYFPVGTPEGSSKEEMKARWLPVRDMLARVAEREGKPLFFMEIGCPSVKGNAARPADWQYPGETDMAEQERFYAAAFEMFWHEPWFKGFFWWDWPPELHQKADALQNRDFCVYGKPAERVLREWYAKPVGMR